MDIKAEAMKFMEGLGVEKKNKWQVPKCLGKERECDQKVVEGGHRERRGR